MGRRRRGAATVFDASAILAVINEEPGGEEVARRMEEPEPVVGAVNLSEVAAKLSERGVPPAEIREAVGGLGLAVLPFDEELAYRTGELTAVCVRDEPGETWVSGVRLRASGFARPPRGGKESRLKDLRHPRRDTPSGVFADA